MPGAYRRISAQISLTSGRFWPVLGIICRSRAALVKIRATLALCFKSLTGRHPDRPPMQPPGPGPRPHGTKRHRPRLCQDVARRDVARTQWCVDRCRFLDVSCSSPEHTDTPCASTTRVECLARSSRSASSKKGCGAAVLPRAPTHPSLLAAPTQRLRARMAANEGAQTTRRHNDNDECNGSEPDPSSKA